MQEKPRRVANRAGSASVDLGAVRLAAVFDQREAVPVRDGAKPREVRRLSEKVRGQDRASARRDRGLDLRGIDQAGLTLDIDEDRYRVLVKDARSGRAPRVGRRDDLVAATDLESGERGLQRAVSRTGREHMPAGVVA